MPGDPGANRAAGAVDEAALVEAVQRLVRAPSWNGNETPAQDVMASLMADAGLEVDRWDIDLDEVTAHPACSMEIPREHAVGLVGTLPGSGGGRDLLLDGHVDVVPPGDDALWTHPPFAGVLEGGRIHGRGALDMKGPLLAGLFAMRAVREAGLVLAGTVRLASVVASGDTGQTAPSSWSLRRWR